MSVVDKARPAKTISLTDTNPALFVVADQTRVPASITVQGSSSFGLILFDVTATGTVNARVPGSVTFTLYGLAQDSDVSTDPNDWLPIGASIAEPIGGAEEQDETMWMIRGKDLMMFPGNGRMQGTFDSNVASTPQPPVDLEHHPDDITDEDPLYVFAVGVSFSPDTPPAEGEESCAVTLASFTLSSE